MSFALVERRYVSCQIEPYVWEPRALGRETATGPHYVTKQLIQAIGHYNQPASRRVDDLESRFAELAETWLEETTFLSSATQAAIHPAYQQIIGMGRPALPLILRELAREPNHWFWALKAITGADPVPPQSRGRVLEMADAWLKWARDEGLLR